MPLSYTIQFGGLCLFVEKDTDPKGLYVLLPQLSPMSGHARHCQMVLAFDANGYVAFPFAGQILDLSSIAPHTKKTGRPPWMADITGVAGSPVDEGWLTTASPTGPLAARVRLPLGSTLCALGEEDAIMLRPPDYQTEVGVRGLVSVRINESDGCPGNVLHDPAALIGIVNTPAEPIQNPTKKYRHDRGDDAHHINAYYKLLKSGTGPMWRIGRDVNQNAATKEPQDQPCLGSTRVSVKPITAKYIDPYNCTVGYGSL